MTLQHTDPARTCGTFCGSKCALCYGAAWMTLTGFAISADLILSMRASEYVELAAQTPIVQRFLMLSELEEVRATDAC